MGIYSHDNTVTIYDSDADDILSISILSGHVFDNVELFKLSRQTVQHIGHSIVYNYGVEDSFISRFKTSYVFLGNNSQWCHRGLFPCGDWSLADVTAAESPTYAPIKAY